MLSYSHSDIFPDTQRYEVVDPADKIDTGDVAVSRCAGAEVQVAEPLCFHHRPDVLSARARVVCSFTTKHWATQSLWTTPPASYNSELLTVSCVFFQLTNDSTMSFGKGMRPCGVGGGPHSARLWWQCLRCGSGSWEHHASAHVSRGIVLSIHGWVERDKFVHSSWPVGHILC